MIVSSSALHTQLGAHLGADFVEFRVGGQRVSLWSEEFTNSLPCESRWTGTAKLPLEKLIAALAVVSDQPVTLDLHAAGPCKLYASKRVRVADDYWNMHVEYEL